MVGWVAQGNVAPGEAAANGTQGQCPEVAKGSRSAQTWVGSLAWKSVEHRRVMGLVFVNLEAEEFVDRADGGGIGTMDHYTAAIGSFLGGVGDFTSEALHVGNSWRNGVVDEQRNVEIAGREGVRDKMPADAVDRVAVFGIAGSDLNDAA